MNTRSYTQDLRFPPHVYARCGKRILGVVLALFIVAATGFAHAQGESRRTVHIEPSDFDPVVVFDTATERCMTFTSIDNPHTESCRVLADPKQVTFDYTRMMISTLLVRPDPQRILVIGLGGGTLPNALAQLTPDAHIDSVDIDPAVLKVATLFFGYQTSERQRAHISDGRAYIEQAIQRGERYDMIMLDAFGESYIPPHMLTREFLLAVKQALSPDGVVVSNTASHSILLARETATYRDVFGPLLSVDAHNNRIVIATAGTLPTQQTMVANAQLWDQRLALHGIDSAVFLDRAERLDRSDLHDGGADWRVMTDANIDDAILTMVPAMQP